MTHMEEFEFNLMEQNRSKHTIKSYLSDLRQFEIWLKGTYGEVELKPAIITKLDVAHYKTHMLTVGQRKPSGVNRALSSIVAFCDWAQTKGYIQENPAAVNGWRRAPDRGS